MPAPAPPSALPLRLARLHAVPLGPAWPRPAPRRPAQRRPARLSAVPLGPAQLCAAQLCAAQLCAAQLCAAQLCAAQLCAAQLCAAHLRAARAVLADCGGFCGAWPVGWSVVAFGRGVGFVSACADVAASLQVSSRRALGVVHESSPAGSERLSAARAGSTLAAKA